MPGSCAIRSPALLRAAATQRGRQPAPERGCVPLRKRNQPQQCEKFKRDKAWLILKAVRSCCGWSSTQPRSEEGIVSGEGAEHDTRGRVCSPCRKRQRPTWPSRQPQSKTLRAVVGVGCHGGQECPRSRTLRAVVGVGFSSIAAAGLRHSRAPEKTCHKMPKGLGGGAPPPYQIGGAALLRRPSFAPGRGIHAASRLACQNA